MIRSGFLRRFLFGRRDPALAVWPSPAQRYAAGVTNLLTANYALFNTPVSSYWTLSGGAVEDATDTRTADGSSCLDLSTDTAKGECKLWPVVSPGSIYTLSYYSKSDTLNGYVRCQVGYYTSANGFIANSVVMRAASKVVGEWVENVAIFRTPATCGKIKPMFSKEGTAVASLRVDDAALYAGIHFATAPTPKRAINGSNVRTDSLGNWQVREAGRWKDFFPFAVYQDTTKTNYQFYADQGFNAVMFGQFSTVIGGRAKAAVNYEFAPYGMRYFAEIAQYCTAADPDYNNLEGLLAEQSAIMVDPSATNYLGAYWDDEVYEYDVPAAVLAQIAATDPTRPIMVNAGSPQAVRNFVALGLPIAAGTYGNDIEKPSTLGADLAIPQFEGALLDYPPGVIVYGMGSDVEVTETQLRRDLWRAIIAGASGFSLYRDGAQCGDLTTHQAWPYIPQIRRDIETLMPAIKAPYWTSWTVASSDAGLVVGPRAPASGIDLYLLIANETDAEVTSTLTVSGLTIIDNTQVYDALTGAKYTTFESNAISITVPAYGTLALRFDSDISTYYRFITEAGDRFVTEDGLFYLRTEG